MRKLVAIVILAAAIAGAITLLTEWSFSEIVQWISNENSRHLLAATTTVLGILGWGWGAMLWVRGRDAASQFELLQQKHVRLQQRLDELPEMMTKVFTPYFNVLIRSVRSKLSAEEQHDVFAKLKLTRLQDEIEGARPGVRRALQSSLDPPSAPSPMRLKRRSDFMIDERSDLTRTALSPREDAAPARPEVEEETPLFENQIRQIVREGIGRSFKEVGIVTKVEPTSPR